MRKFKLKPKDEVAEATPACEHKWKRFKETLVPQERSTQQIQMGLEWKGLSAFFTVKACIDCKEKVYLDYTVER